MSGFFGRTSEDYATTIEDNLGREKTWVESIGFAWDYVGDYFTYDPTDTNGEIYIPSPATELIFGYSDYTGNEFDFTESLADSTLQLVDAAESAWSFKWIILAVVALVVAWWVGLLGVVMAMKGKK